MSDRQAVTLSRRQLLAGIGTVGAAGSLVGVGTAAFVADGERIRGTVAAGRVELDVDWAHVAVDAAGHVQTRQTGNSRDDTVAVDLGALDADDPYQRTGWLVVELSLPADGYPATLWLWSCRQVDEGLGTALQVSVFDLDSEVGRRYLDGQQSLDDPGRYTDADAFVLGGSLHDVSAALAAGYLLGGRPDDSETETKGADCLRNGTARTLLFRWDLDEEFVGEAAAEIALEFGATQCRHGLAADNPFANYDVVCGPAPGGSRGRNERAEKDEREDRFEEGGRPEEQGGPNSDGEDDAGESDEQDELEERGETTESSQSASSASPKADDGDGGAEEGEADEDGTNPIPNRQSGEEGA